MPWPGAVLSWRHTAPSPAVSPAKPHRGPCRPTAPGARPEFWVQHSFPLGKPGTESGQSFRIPSSLGLGLLCLPSVEQEQKSLSSRPLAKVTRQPEGKTWEGKPIGNSGGQQNGGGGSVSFLIGPVRKLSMWLTLRHPQRQWTKQGPGKLQ